MIKFIAKLLGFVGPELTTQQLEEGTIVDVRTRAEFQRGHLPGSRNIPLQEMGAAMDEIQAMSSPVILCCASGARSSRATSRLKQAGVSAINAGSWRNLARKMADK
ncbi:MAG: rhodanese-like domain-containing protein [Bacteroidota bacterium]